MSVAYSGGKTSNQVSAWEMHAVTTVAHCSFTAALSSHLSSLNAPVVLMYMQ
jgi:hypothetical protein